MVTVQEVFSFLNTLAPVRWKMDFDNVGHLVGDGDAPVSRILAALDITEAVIAEAIDTGTELIVSHHPLIFHPLRQVTASEPAGRKILTMARHGLSAVCMHTNLDIAAGGVNDALMAVLGAKVTGLLEELAPDTETGQALGCGRIGTLPAAMPLPDFLHHAAERLSASGLRYHSADRPVEKLAVCGGAGGDLLELAAAKGCDTLLTADIKYDRFLAAEALGLNLIDADHFCTEDVVIQPLADALQRRFPDLAVTKSRRLRQTAQFYIP